MDYMESEDFDEWIDDITWAKEYYDTYGNTNVDEDI
jgi:hypothetical protein